MSFFQEPHKPRLTYEEAVAKAEKSDRPLSIFLFLNRLKSFYVDASNAEHPIVFICVPRNQQRSFIQVGTPDTMVSPQQIIRIRYTFDKQSDENSF